jgi:hypothetical protein
MREAQVVSGSRSLKYVRSGTNCAIERHIRQGRFASPCLLLVMADLRRQDFHRLGNCADLLRCRGPSDGFLSSATLFAQGACTSRSLPTITKSEFSNVIISNQEIGFILPDPV